ncbi:hypothetical protein SNE25_09585 [Mucilaginibacter sabulilitoris]|uniref:Uncharacterized protein n=1 Tax=Mucilaginibacter sabulilitoris TaxID=1173583 RepID=A0ABZ0TS78_9SPHI|nr:hypothetical protein [Mucilaginibacter sabulilitoris]WPU95769.1 hypothetical protein SNE25_09585 [Mucilaginibacter sabulilitoris]
MRVFFVLLIILTESICSGFAQVNVPLLHQLVAESQSEHSKQEEARNKQALVWANEDVNRLAMIRLQQGYRTLQDRFHTLSIVIGAAQIGLQAAPIIAEITRQQRLIIGMAENSPTLIALVYNVEADLTGRAYLLGNYLYGLLLSIGDLNQMKASDRRILMAHVLTELRRIEGTSQGLVTIMRDAAIGKVLAADSPFPVYVNSDKQIGSTILNKAANFKLTAP